MSTTKIAQLLKQYQTTSFGGLDNQNLSNFECLDLSGCDITDDDIPELCEFLLKNPNIKSLLLTDNKISDKGVILLSQNSTIVTLSLGLNQIGNEGTKALSQNPNIVSLCLYGNKIDNEGARWLTKNPILTYIDVSENKGIGKELETTINSRIKDTLARKIHFSRLYGQVLRSYDKAEKNPHYHDRFLAEQIFSLAVSPSFFHNQQIKNITKIGMQEYSDKPISPRKNNNSN